MSKRTAAEMISDIDNAINGLKKIRSAYSNDNHERWPEFIQLLKTGTIKEVRTFVNVFGTSQILDFFFLPGSYPDGIVVPSFSAQSFDMWRAVSERNESYEFVKFLHEYMVPLPTPDNLNLNSRSIKNFSENKKKFVVNLFVTKALRIKDLKINVIAKGTSASIKMPFVAAMVYIDEFSFLLDIQKAGVNIEWDETASWTPKKAATITGNLVKYEQYQALSRNIKK